MMRRRLLEGVEMLARGETPPALEAGAQRVRSASLIAGREVAYEELSRDILATRPGVPVTSV